MLPALLATIFAAWRWPSTILAQARIAKTPFWCACTAVPGRGLSPTGAFFIGRNGNVGEIGHIQVDPLGERCHCGNFGCLETVAANAAIEQRVRHLLEQGYQSRLTPDDCTIKTICKAANKGDALACEVIEYVGRHLGKTIAIAINLFNPQKNRRRRRNSGS